MTTTKPKPTVHASTRGASITLFARADALAIVNDWIDEHGDEIAASGGELPPELEQLLDDAEGDLKTKVERVALKIRELDSLADAAEVEQKRLAQLAKVRSNAVKGLKDYLRRGMEHAGEKSIKTSLCVVRVQANPATARYVGDAEALRSGKTGSEKLDALLRYVEPVAGYHDLDSRATAAAYKARRDELRELSMAIEMDEEGEQIVARIVGDNDQAAEIDAVRGEVLADRRWAYVNDALAAEFPGVQLVEGSHLRIA